MDDNVRTLIYNTAVKGEQERGSDGVVLYEPNAPNGTRVEWIKLQDVKPEQFQETVADLLSEESSLFAFVMEVHGHQVHLWKIPRSEMLNMGSRTVSEIV